jgi:hypothetical protein
MDIDKLVNDAVLMDGYIMVRDKQGICKYIFGKMQIKDLPSFLLPNFGNVNANELNINDYCFHDGLTQIILTISEIKKVLGIIVSMEYDIQFERKINR